MRCDIIPFMDFYQSISDYYDLIFPHSYDYTEKLVTLMDPEGLLAADKSTTLVDAGCATGRFAENLSRMGYSVFAFDLDLSMIEMAQDRCSEMDNPPHFECMNLLEISRLYPRSADAIFCMGNTLVHLTDPEDCIRFFSGCAETMKNGGRLIVQIINYDRILDLNVDGLPSIENHHLIFRRYYDRTDDPGLLIFRTELYIKSIGRTITNCIPLKAYKQNELKRFLDLSGFSNVSFFGDADMSPLTENSVPMFFTATRA